MKKVIRMTESQLKKMVEDTINEQSNKNYFDVYKKTGGELTQVSPNHMMDNESYEGQSYHIWDNGRVMSVDNSDKTNKLMGTMVIISDSSYKFVWDNGYTYDSATDKVTKTVTQPKINTVNCAPQLLDITKGKILKFGCKTQGVKELQTLLDFTKPTGYFGNITKQKVMDFQKKNNLKVDGIVGPETYKSLTPNAVPAPAQDVKEYDDMYDDDDDYNELDNLFTDNFDTEDDYDGEPFRGDDEGFSDKMRVNQIKKKIKLGNINMGDTYYQNKDKKKQREFEKRKYAGLDPLRNDNQPEPYSPIRSNDLPLDKYLEKKKMGNLDEDEDIAMLDNLFTKDETPSQDVNEEGTTNTNLTVPEQTLLGFLNRFLRGEEGEFQNTPIEQLKSNMMFNSKTIYPMAQKLLEKKRTGKKTYDDKTFNALFLSMDKAITKEQRYEFFNDAANITNITYNSEF
jgi:peptidoglycan hydrolase-like protein with peptidoglycan-binding domain